MFYASVITLPLGRLTALVSLIEKVQVQAKEKNIADSLILDARIAPDMLPFSVQIQVSTDNAKGMASRMARREIPSYPDTETTLDELVARLQKTIAYLQTFSESDFADAATAEARFPYFPGKKLVGAGYVYTYAIPNLLFHTTTAYDILRHMGFDIGKADYMGKDVAMLPDGE